MLLIRVEWICFTFFLFCAYMTLHLNASPSLLAISSLLHPLRSLSPRLDSILASCTLSFHAFCVRSRLASVLVLPLFLSLRNDTIRPPTPTIISCGPSLALTRHLCRKTAEKYCAPSAAKTRGRNRNSPATTAIITSIPLLPPSISSVHVSMSFSRTVTRLTLAPTTRSAASGVPVARGINLQAPGAADAHAGHGAEGRTDYADIPKWATRTDFKSSGSGLVSRTRLNGSSSSSFASFFHLFFHPGPRFFFFSFVVQAWTDCAWIRCWSE